MFFYIILLCIIGFHGLLLQVTQFTAWPEMMAYPYLLNHGFSFYGDIIHPYLPGLPFLLKEVFGIFGVSINVLQWFTTGIIVLIDLLVASIAMQLFTRKQALFGLFVFVVLQVFFEGNGLWFDLAVIPCVLGAFYYFLQFKQHKTHVNLFISGVFLGVAFIIKQTAIWYIALVGSIVLIHVLQRRYTIKSIFLFSVSAALPFVLLFFLFNAKDILFWGILLPFTMMPKTPGYIVYPSLRQLIVTIVIFSPIVLVLFQHKEHRMSILWFIASLGFLVPRFAYFHIQPALPFFIFCFLGVLNYVRKQQYAAWGIGIYAIFSAVLIVRFFITHIVRPPRFFDPQILSEVAAIKSTIGDDQPVFFYNTPANYMVAGGFIPPKPWADTFPWYLEVPDIQKDIVQSLDTEQVEWVVMHDFGDGDPYALGVYQPSHINAYIEENFIQETRINDTLQILRRKTKES